MPRAVTAGRKLTRATEHIQHVCRYLLSGISVIITVLLSANFEK
jgi:hypothetical protein